MWCRLFMFFIPHYIHETQVGLMFCSKVQTKKVLIGSLDNQNTFSSRVLWQWFLSVRLMRNPHLRVYKWLLGRILSLGEGQFWENSPALMVSGLSSYLDDWFRSIHTPGNTKIHILLILFPVIMDNDDNNNNRLLRTESSGNALF